MQTFFHHALSSLFQELMVAISKVRLPWFRVHIVILNDPGRLISVHIMHTGLVSGWSSAMLLYEVIILDSSDPVYNPIWRQGCFIAPFVPRIGVINSLYWWSIGIGFGNGYNYWAYETVCWSHLLLSGLCILASSWHWAYWDLDVFQNAGIFLLDLTKVCLLYTSDAADD